MFRTLVILAVFMCLLFPMAASAADASRIGQVVLLTGGVLLQITGVQFEKQAHESYDAYLHTARPSEMIRLTDDYDQKHLRSLVSSKVGVGMIGLAALWALTDQFKFTRNVQIALEPREMRVAFDLLKR